MPEEVVRRVIFQQSLEMARRSILQTLRQPAMVIPPVLFPLVLMGINVGGLDAATNIPGFPTDSYLDFAIAFPFIQGSLFASINAGSAVARDVETGFLNRLALTPMQRAAMLLGNLSGVMVVALISSLIYLAVGFAAGLHFETGVPGVLVLLVLALLIALAFASLGLVHRVADRLGRSGPGRLPALLRLPVPVVELAAARADRAGLVPDDRHLQPDLVPVRGPALADHLRLGGQGAGDGLRLRARARGDRRGRLGLGPADAGWRGHEALHGRRGRRRLALDQEGLDEPAAAAAVADLPAVLLRRLRGRAVVGRQRAGVRLPVGLHGVPVRVRAAAGVGVRRRLHRLRDRRRTSRTGSRGG